MSATDRRELLRQMSLFISGLATAQVLSSCKRTGSSAQDASVAPPKKAPTTKSEPLKPIQRTTLAAGLARMIPSEEGSPGAKEANVIEYVDKELARSEYAQLRTHVLAGVVAMNRNAQRDHKKQFAELDEAAQDDVLLKLQHGSERGADFIKFLVLLTLEGFFGDPKWGGNKDGIGWKLSGYGPGTVTGEVGGHGGH